MVAEATCVSLPWQIIPMVITGIQDYIADSDEDAQAFRFDGALDSDMMSPRTGASLAGDWWHR
jgi:hypothetical protein